MDRPKSVPTEQALAELDQVLDRLLDHVVVLDSLPAPAAPRPGPVPLDGHYGLVGGLL